ncbi:hypothetical protein PSTG_19960, partial [Puccinia striiformis f. sp. tritici PST-78]
FNCPDSPRRQAPITRACPGGFTCGSSTISLSKSEKAGWTRYRFYFSCLEEFMCTFSGKRRIFPGPQ